MMADDNWILSAGINRWQVLHLPHVRVLREMLLSMGMYPCYRQIRFEQRYRQIFGTASNRSSLDWHLYSDTALRQMLELLVAWWFLLSTTDRVFFALHPVKRYFGLPL